MYISPFDEDEKITDYDGATLFGESTLSYKGEKLIYFMRKPFTQGGENGKLEAEVQGTILEEPTEDDGKKHYMVKKIPKNERENIEDAIRSKKGNVCVKFR